MKAFLRKAISMALYRSRGEPTPAQLKAGDYEKRKVAWKDQTLAIENEAGHVRRGTNRDGVTWEIRMKFAYGEILGSKGVDGDPVDCFLGPNMESATHVYVVHARKVNRWDQYDEDKCMLGFDSEEDAKAAFLSCYSDPRFLGDVTAMPVDEFVNKVRATKEKPAMIKAIFIKASTLVSVPVMVAGSVDKHGHVRTAHMATRKVALDANQSKLDKFIAAHGGPDRLRAQIEKMTPQQRAHLIAAMTHIDSITEHAVLVKLGMRKDRKRVLALVETETAEAVPAPEPEPTPSPVVEETPPPPPPQDPVAEVAAQIEPEPTISEMNEHFETPLGVQYASDEDDPNSPNYRFRDTGYVSGSRKEMASEQIRSAGRNGDRLRATDIDWDELEKNSREAAILINKSNLFGRVDWDALKEAGMQPDAGYLVDRVYASVGSEPNGDSAQARKDYALGLETLRDRMEKCENSQQVTDVLKEIRDEITGEMLNARESEEYQAIHSEYVTARKHARAAEEERHALYQKWNILQSQLQSAEYEHQKRTNRGWKPDPELVDKINSLQPLVEAASAERIAFDDARPELKGKRRDLGGGYTSMDNDLEFAARQIGNRAAEIKSRAQQRNIMENPLTRAWTTLGDRFLSVVNYRSYKGSQAFLTHVTAAKNNKIKDWSWAEKETIARPTVTKKQVSFQLKVAEKFDRVGGRHVNVSSTEDLKSRFGLREVQSGNWVLSDVNSASFHVQKAAEALSDMADVLGVPDSQIAVNGRIALAFGARGSGSAGWKKGAARAHYESVQRVINLTKMGGGGCLGHELFHAIDNVVKEVEGGSPANTREFLTETPELIPEGELRDAFSSLKDAMHQGPHRMSETFSYSAHDHRAAKLNVDHYSMRGGVSQIVKNSANATDAVLGVKQYFQNAYGADMKKWRRKTTNVFRDWQRMAVAYHDNNEHGAIDVAVPTGAAMSSFALESTVLDDGVHGKYWSKGRELAARAFQSYCEDKLESLGRRNDYLSVYADNKYHSDGKPYPEGAERSRINRAFDNLFAVMAKRGTLAKAFEALSNVQQAEVA